MLASSNYHFAENVTICLYKEDTFELIWICLTDLSAEDGCKGADEEDADDAHDEGEDGGEEEAPPLPLLEALLLPKDGHTLRGACFHPAQNAHSPICLKRVNSQAVG